MIRRLNATDAVRVWKLAKDFIVTTFQDLDKGISEDVLKTRLVEFKDWSYGMFDKDGELIGVLAGGVTELFLTRELCWYEALFYVAKPHRRKVKTFVKYVQDDLKGRHIKYMTLGLPGSNKGLRHVYKKLGYRLFDCHYITKL